MLQTGETEAHNGEVTCSNVACGRAKNRKEVARVFLHPFTTSVLV